MLYDWEFAFPVTTKTAIGFGIACFGLIPLAIYAFNGFNWRRKPGNLEKPILLKSTKEQEPEYSLQNAMSKLNEMFSVISENITPIYLKKIEDIDPSLLKTIALSFSSASFLFKDFLKQWSNSKSTEPDAIEKSKSLDDRIDIKLYQTSKLDFNQLKRILIRLNRIDDALHALSETSFRLKYYEEACIKKGIPEYAGLAELFRVYSIDKLKEDMKIERRTLENQIERCTLYYQSKLNTSTLNVAYVALGISALSVALTVIGLLLLK